MNPGELGLCYSVGGFALLIRTGRHVPIMSMLSGWKIVRFQSPFAPAQYLEEKILSVDAKNIPFQSTLGSR